MHTYKKAPVVQAVLQLQFQKPISAKHVEKITKKASTFYPSVEPLMDYEISVDPAINGGSPKMTATRASSRMQAADPSQMFTVGPGQFTTSQLAPYLGWQEFFQRFIRDFNMITKITGHPLFNRIGLRYINRLDVPENIATFDIQKEYLNIYPSVSGKLGQYAGNMVHVEFQNAECDSVVLVNSGLNAPVLINHVSYILDIDIVRTNNIPMKFDDLFNCIEKMRKAKNEIFEELVTDKARKLFDA